MSQQVNYGQELEKLIDIVVSKEASDLHLSVNSHPIIRVAGTLIPLTDKPILTNVDVQGFINASVTEDFFQLFLQNRELDFSFKSHKARFRGNAFFQQGNMGMISRLIPNNVSTFEDLNLPDALSRFAMQKQGFFLCVGPVGQGKSTTLAAMVEYINTNEARHIVTIENPIEHVYESKQSLIDQREVKIDTNDFATALVSALRQDVNVILVGEMRDLATIEAAITAAETGHLVLSTLHTNDAAQTIDRIIDSFPSDRHRQIRTQLSSAVSGVISQRLIPKIEGGRIPAYELMINNAAVSNLIREGRTIEVKSVIETGSEQGMIDMNRSLVDLISKNEVSKEDAFSHAVDPIGLERLLATISTK